MSVENTADAQKVALFDSTSGFAFGPVFDNAWEADEFLQWLRDDCGIDDARRVAPAKWLKLWAEFSLAQETR